jgi:hypothetical protein
MAHADRWMFSKEEVLHNLLGCLELTLFMPKAGTRFTPGMNEALRSFAIPGLFFPLMLLSIIFYPDPAFAVTPPATLLLLYTARMFVIWFLFFGTVYAITRWRRRKDRFWAFVSAYNWMAVPCVLAFLPAWGMLLEGSKPEDLYPLMMCLITYSYLMLAFAAMRVLQISWEMAGFITLVSLNINGGTLYLVQLINGSLVS